MSENMHTQIRREDPIFRTVNNVDIRRASDGMFYAYVGEGSLLGVRARAADLAQEIRKRLLDPIRVIQTGTITTAPKVIEIYVVERTGRTIKMRGVNHNPVWVIMPIWHSEDIYERIHNIWEARNAEFSLADNPGSRAKVADKYKNDFAPIAESCGFVSHGEIFQRYRQLIEAERLQPDLSSQTV